MTVSPEYRRSVDPFTPERLTWVPHRFVALDLMRGIAAMAVMLLHCGYFFGLDGMFRHGYLAVDFFFMLSGFVMVAAYQERLDKGWSTRNFIQVRIIRLYPLYLLGLLLGFSFHLLRNRLGSIHDTFHNNLLFFLLGVCFLPAVAGPGDLSSYLFPYDIPTWSLFYELFGNLVHGVALRRRSTRFLVVWMVVAGVPLACAVWKSGGLNLGYNRAQFGYGVTRALFSYTFGILLYGVWMRHRPRWPLWLSCLMLILPLLGVPSWTRFTAVYDLLITILVFPPLILFSASTQVPPIMRRPALIAGNASYAVYVLHVPLADWFQQVWLRAFGHRLTYDTPWGGLVFVVFVSGIAICLDRLYDTPLRSLLHGRQRGD